MLLILLVALPVAFGSGSSGESDSRLFNVDVPQVALTVFTDTEEFQIAGRILYETYEVANGKLLTRVVARFNKVPGHCMQDFNFKVRQGDSHNASAIYMDLTLFRQPLSSSLNSNPNRPGPVLEMEFVIPSKFLSVQDMVGKDYYSLVQYQYRMTQEEVIKVARTNC